MAQLQQLQIAFGSTEDKAVELNNARISALIAAIGTKRTGSAIGITQDRTTEASLLSGWIKPQDGETITESNKYVLNKSNVNVQGDVAVEEYRLLTDGRDRVYEGKSMTITCMNGDGRPVAMQSMVVWLFIDFGYKVVESELITEEDIRSQFDVSRWTNLGNNVWRGVLRNNNGIIKIGEPTKNYTWSVPVEVRAYPASIDEQEGITDEIRTNRLTEPVSFNASAISVNTADIICNTNNINIGDQLIFRVNLGPADNTKLEFNPSYTVDFTSAELIDMGNYFLVPSGLSNFSVNAVITYMGRQFTAEKSFAVAHTILSKNMNPVAWGAVYNGLKAADAANGTTRWNKLTEDSEFGTGDAAVVNGNEFVHILRAFDSISVGYSFDEAEYFSGFNELVLEATSTEWNVLHDCTSFTLSNNVKIITIEGIHSVGDVFMRCAVFTANGVEIIRTLKDDVMVRLFESTSVKEIHLDSLRTISTKYMGELRLFLGNHNLVSFSLPKLERVDVSSSNRMFYSCENLQHISLPKLATISDIGSTMFFGCQQLVSFDLSSLKDITTDTFEMFRDCTKLQEAAFPSLERITISSYNGKMQMFENCSALERFVAKKLSYVGMASGSAYNITTNDMFKGCERLSYVEMGTDAPSLTFSRISGEMFHSAGNSVGNIEVYLNNLAMININGLFKNCYFLFSENKILDWGNTQLADANSGITMQLEYMLKDNITIGKVVLPSTLNSLTPSERLFEDSVVAIVDLRKATTISRIDKLFADSRNKMLFYHTSAAIPPVASFDEDNTMPIFVGSTGNSKALADIIMQRYFTASNWSSLYNQLGYDAMMADYNKWLADKSVPCVWRKGGDTQYKGLTPNAPYYHLEDGSYSLESGNDWVLYIEQGNTIGLLATNRSTSQNYILPCVKTDDGIIIPYEGDGLDYYCTLRPELQGDGSFMFYCKKMPNRYLYAHNGLYLFWTNGTTQIYDKFDIADDGTLIELQNNRFIAAVKNFVPFGSDTQSLLAYTLANLHGSQYAKVKVSKKSKVESCETRFGIVMNQNDNELLMLGTNEQGTEFKVWKVTLNKNGTFPTEYADKALFVSSEKSLGASRSLKSPISGLYLYFDNSNKAISLVNGANLYTINEIYVFNNSGDQRGIYYNAATDKIKAFKNNEVETGFTKSAFAATFVISYTDSRTRPTEQQVHASNVNANRIFPQYMKDFMCESVMGVSADKFKADMNAAKGTENVDYDYEDITPELLDDYGLTIE